MDLTIRDVKQIVREELERVFEMKYCTVCKGESRMVKAFTFPEKEMELATEYRRCLTCNTLFKVKMEEVRSKPE